MYSPGAIDLRTADPVELPRLTDRVSWLQVEHAQITQSRTGLVAWYGLQLAAYTADPLGTGPLATTET